MISGYREAVETLAKTALASKTHDDQLVYPIVFLYRHLFELSLKAIVQTSGHRVAVVPNFTDHRLSPRWKEAFIVISEMQLCGLEGEEYVGPLLKEFDENDKRSFNFRYHTDTKGQLQGLLNHEFDLLGFVEAADAVGNYLDLILGMVWEREEYLTEAEVSI